MADYYELLVKEYLEQQGYIVRLDVRFSKSTGGISDIDILAYKCDTDEAILGEVKCAHISKKRIDDEDRDFNDPNLIATIKSLIGNRTPKKYIYCWSINDKIKQEAKQNYDIEVIQFPEIINYLIDEVVASRAKGRWIYDSYPNTMLLQLLYSFSKPNYEEKTIKLSKLQKK